MWEPGINYAGIENGSSELVMAVLSEDLIGAALGAQRVGVGGGSAEPVGMALCMDFEREVLSNTCIRLSGSWGKGGQFSSVGLEVSGNERGGRDQWESKETGRGYDMK
ncbi:hypothetical protein BY996DRAFT_6422943 [Phakopsora pachyrhizi]|nr:hypothetical protein BY996DRAFT_6422943 [Phakopsora pachyrhizi]